MHTLSGTKRHGTLRQALLGFFVSSLFFTLVFGLALTLSLSSADDAQAASYKLPLPPMQEGCYGVASYGIPLFDDGEGSVVVDSPGPVEVALINWVGHDDETPPADGESEVIINGQEVTGIRPPGDAGADRYGFTNSFWYAWYADIGPTGNGILTSEDPVTINFSGWDSPTNGSFGATVTVIYDTGPCDQNTDVHLEVGVDFYFHATPQDRKSELLVFEFDPVAEDRIGTAHLVHAGTDSEQSTCRGGAIWMVAGGGSAPAEDAYDIFNVHNNGRGYGVNGGVEIINDPFTSASLPCTPSVNPDPDQSYEAGHPCPDGAATCPYRATELMPPDGGDIGPQWGIVTVDVMIPANTSWIAFQLESEKDQNGESGAWAGAGVFMLFEELHDFTLEASPFTRTAAQGSSVSYLLTADCTDGYSQYIEDLSVSGLPSGTSATFSPESFDCDGSSVLEVQTDDTAELGTKVLTISGVGDGVGERSTQAELEVIPMPPPDSPANLSIDNSVCEIMSLSWDDNSDNEDGFRIYRSDEADPDFPDGFIFVAETGENITTYDDDTAPPDAAYYYAITAFNDGGESVIENTNWYDEDWVYRNKITIDDANVSGSSDLVDYALLIQRTASELRHTSHGGDVGVIDGSDILFTASDGMTKLAHEIEFYDPEEGRLTAWVKVPTLSASADTKLYMYYNNPSSSDQQNQTGVWVADYEGVWHLSDESGNLQDSTANNLDATPVSVTQGASGKVNKAITVDTSSNRAEAADSGNLDFGSNDDFTISLWVKSSQTAQTNVWPMPLSKEGNVSGSRQGYNFLTHNSTMKQEWQFEIFSGGTNYSADGLSDIRDGSWHNLSATRSGDIITVYEDGVFAGQTAATSADISNAHDLVFGQRDTLDTWSRYSGSIDEVRVSSVARTADWIATEYANYNAPELFYIFGNQEDEQTSSSSAIAGPVFNNDCRADLSLSNKIIYEVNGEPYVGGDVINNGDVISFRIIINNSGDDTAYRLYIEDTLSDNLDYVPDSVSATGDGIQIIGEHINGQTVTWDTNQRIGDKEANSENWVVSFDAVVDSDFPRSIDFFNNTARIYYSLEDNNNRDQSVQVSTGARPFRTGRARVPDIQEIAP